MTLNKTHITISVFLSLFFSICFSQKKQSEIDSLINIGTVEIYENPEKSIQIGKEIASDSLNNVNAIIKGLLLTAKAYTSKRDYQSSLSYALRAKSLLSKTNDELIKINVMDRIAIQYHQLGIFDKAIEALNESEKLCLKYPIQDSVHLTLGNNYAIRGFIYREQLNCEIAIGYFNKSISEYKKSNNQNVTPNWSIVLYNKGNCYILLSDYQSAKENYKDAILLAEKVSAQSLKAFALKGLAEVLTLEGKYDESITILEQAIEISDKVGDLILNREISRGLSQNYLGLNNLDYYNKFNTEYNKLLLQIKVSERSSVSNSIEDTSNIFNTNFQTKRPSYIYIIVVIWMFVIVIITLIFVNEKRTQKRIQTLISTIENHKKNQKK